MRRLAEEVHAKLVPRGEADASQVHLGLEVECVLAAAKQILYVIKCNLTRVGRFPVSSD